VTTQKLELPQQGLTQVRESVLSGVAVQRKARTGTQAGSVQLHYMNGGGTTPLALQNQTGIPLQMLERAERLGGMSLRDVRVHYNSARPAMLGALAYTQGTDIFMGPGQERHLGHELRHVVQQKRGQVQPEYDLGGLKINASPSLEREADQWDGALSPLYISWEGRRTPEPPAVQMLAVVQCFDWKLLRNILKSSFYTMADSGQNMAQSGLSYLEASAGENQTNQTQSEQVMQALQVLSELSGTQVDLAPIENSTEPQVQYQEPKIVLSVIGIIMQTVNLFGVCARAYERKESGCSYGMLIGMAIGCLGSLGADILGALGSPAPATPIVAGVTSTLGTLLAAVSAYKNDSKGDRHGMTRSILDAVTGALNALGQYLSICAGKTRLEISTFIFITEVAIRLARWLLTVLGCLKNPDKTPDNNDGNSGDSDGHDGSGGSAAASLPEETALEMSTVEA